MEADAYRFLMEEGPLGAPLLVALHGTGGDAAGILAFAASLLPGATVLAPEGDVLEGNAARFFRRTAEGVYDLDDLARASRKMAGFVGAHARALASPAVLGVGFSNGANILASTLFLRPDLFDAAVLLHPLIPFEPDIRGSLRAKPILVTAGRRDPICPPALTARLAAWLEAAGAALTLRWHEGGHEIGKEEVAAAQSLFARFRGATLGGAS